MSSKKKRNKPYKGSASSTRPTITRVAAVSRSPIHQWWVDRRRMAKPIAIAAGIVVIIIITVIGIIGLIW